MNIYTFIAKFEEKNPDSLIFNNKRLEANGESIADMRVSKKLKTVTGSDGDKHECYVVNALRKKCNNGPVRVTYYFDKESLCHIST